MKKFLLVSTLVMFVAAARADACETHSVKVLCGPSAKVLASNIKVLPLSAVPEIKGIVELSELQLPTIQVPQIVELAPVANVMEVTRLASDAKSAVWQVQVEEEKRGGVALTIVSALGKALLKMVATLIHHVV